MGFAGGIIAPLPFLMPPVTHIGDERLKSRFAWCKSVASSV